MFTICQIYPILHTIATRYIICKIQKLIFNTRHEAMNNLDNKNSS